MENFGVKNRPTINLNLFTALSGSFSSPNPSKSPKNFQDGVVGLGIVAAMTDSSNTQEALCFSPSLRSSSTPKAIVSSAKAAANFRGGVNWNNFDELSENDTRVISHFGDNLIKKHVCFDGKRMSCGVFTALSSSPDTTNIGLDKLKRDFLSYCYLCKRELLGMDIFMYRGEKAFCSVECRDKQIRSDDVKDKDSEMCGSEARKQLDFSVSTCSKPQVYFAGVVAA